MKPACFAGAVLFSGSASGMLPQLATESALAACPLCRLSLPPRLLSGVVTCPSEVSACWAMALSTDEKAKGKA